MRLRSVPPTLPFALVAVALTATACQNSTAPYGDLAEATAKAKGIWTAEGLTSYSFVANRACECVLEAAGPVRVVVQGAQVASATLVSTGAVVDTALWFDVNALFTLIERELREQPSLLEVSFDAARGYPTRVKYGAIEVDAGAIIVVSEFTPG